MKGKVIDKKCTHFLFCVCALCVMLPVNLEDRSPREERPGESGLVV